MHVPALALAALCGTPTVSTSVRPPAAAHAPAASHSPAPEALRADELLSARARRRIAAYLRMRLLEMREQGLERAALAVERKLRVDELIEGNR